jgi:hypothetical protein
MPNHTAQAAPQPITSKLFVSHGHHNEVDATQGDRSLFFENPDRPHRPDRYTLWSCKQDLVLHAVCESIFVLVSTVGISPTQPRPSSFLSPGWGMTCLNERHNVRDARENPLGTGARAQDVIARFSGNASKAQVVHAGYLQSFSHPAHSRKTSHTRHWPSHTTLCATSVWTALKKSHTPLKLPRESSYETLQLTRTRAIASLYST